MKRTRNFYVGVSLVTVVGVLAVARPPSVRRPRPSRGAEIGGTGAWSGTRGSPPGPPGPLIGLGLRDWNNLKRVHLKFWVEGGLFDEAWIYDEGDPVYCNRSLGNVCC